MSFHQYSWNSEVEATWISLIGWHHKTSNTYVPTMYIQYANRKILHCSIGTWNMKMMPFETELKISWHSIEKVFKVRGIVSKLSFFIKNYLQVFFSLFPSIMAAFWTLHESWQFVTLIFLSLECNCFNVAIRKYSVCWVWNTNYLQRLA